MPPSFAYCGGNCPPPLPFLFPTPMQNMTDRKCKSSVLQISIVGCRRLESKLNAAYVVLLGATHGTR